jgi:hypothetical protein
LFTNDLLNKIYMLIINFLKVKQKKQKKRKWKNINILF